MPPKSGRHHVGNFDLTPEPTTPPQSAAPAPIASPTPMPKPAPPARVRMGAHQVPPRKGYVPNPAAPSLELNPIRTEEPYRSPDERLTGLQKEMLAALDAEAENVRPEIMIEVRNVVRGNLLRTSMVANKSERVIFSKIGIPGYT